MSERVWKGDPSLEQFVVPIDDLKPWPGNPRTHNLSAVARSLDLYGQLRPVIVQKASGLLVAGHGTTEAARDLLGWTHLARITPDLNDDEAKGFLLMDNRSSDLGGYDLPLLTSALNDLADRGRLDTTGYNPDDLDDLLASLASQTPPPLPPDTGGGEGSAHAAAGAGGGADVKEMVLLLSSDDHARFVNYVKMLQREYDVRGLTEAVYEAVERQAKAL